MSQPFWQSKTLTEMTQAEWESLCDGCAKCCLHKLQDEDSGDVYYTKVACRYLDLEQCRCRDYSRRQMQVPTCLCLKPEDIAEFHWLPSTCAYRLIAEGKPLPAWHHLVSGSHDTIHEQEISVRGKVLSEEHVHPDGLQEHIVRWIE
jgi:hypothetical protein